MDQDKGCSQVGNRNDIKLGSNGFMHFSLGYTKAFTFIKLIVVVKVPYVFILVRFHIPTVCVEIFKVYKLSWISWYASIYEN